MYFDRGHPFLRNFNSTIPDDVIRVKSNVDSFLDPTCVPVWISINNLTSFQIGYRSVLWACSETSEGCVLDLSSFPA